MSITQEEAKTVREASQNALLLATKHDEKITSLESMFKDAINQMADVAEATREVSSKVEKVLTENSYTKQAVEKVTADVERHNMSEETIQKTIQNVDRIVKKEATYDETAKNQSKTGWAVIMLFISFAVAAVITVTASTGGKPGQLQTVKK